jgi:hypothetical protein
MTSLGRELRTKNNLLEQIQNATVQGRALKNTGVAIPSNAEHFISHTKENQKEKYRIPRVMCTKEDIKFRNTVPNKGCLAKETNPHIHNNEIHYVVAATPVVGKKTRIHEIRQLHTRPGK